MHNLCFGPESRTLARLLQAPKKRLCEEDLHRRIKLRYKK